RPRAALEQRVAAEQRADLGRVQADRAGRVAGSVQDLQHDPAGLDLLAVGEWFVRDLVPVDLLPEHLVVGVQPDRRAGAAGQVGGGVDVVVVRVRADDGPHLAPAHPLGDGLRVVRGVDDDDLAGVGDLPDVVVDAPRAAVARHGCGRHDPVVPRTTAAY